MNSYREQYDRMRRWFRRFSDIEHGKQHDRPSDDYQDDVYAFFMSCYHLKDWIKNDSAVAAAGLKVEAMINDNYDLKLCADICNAHKHLKLTSSRSKQNPTFGPRHFKVHVGPTVGPRIQVSYVVDTSAGPRDAFAIAESCVRAWDNFIAAEIGP